MSTLANRRSGWPSASSIERTYARVELVRRRRRQLVTERIQLLNCVLVRHGGEIRLQQEAVSYQP